MIYKSQRNIQINLSSPTVSNCDGTKKRALKYRNKELGMYSPFLKKKSGQHVIYRLMTGGGQGGPS